MFNMLNTLGQFDGSPAENARQHLKSFMEICNSFKIHGVSNDVLKLKLFPYSLRNKITSFRQEDDEAMHEAWECYRDLFKRCPMHGLPEWTQVSIFYNSVNTPTRMMLDASANETLLDKPPREGLEILVKLTQNDYQHPTTCRGNMRDENVELGSYSQISGESSWADIPTSDTDIPAQADISASADEDYTHPSEPEEVENPSVTPHIKLSKTDKLEKIRPPPPFSQSLKKQKQDYQFKKFFDILKQVHINLPLVEALQQMPNHARFLKDTVSRKTRIGEFETAAATETCLAMMHNKVPAKKTDPGSFTIPCSIGHNYSTKALCDPGASINLMPKSIFQKLGIGEAKPTTVMLQLADHSFVQPEGKIEDILVRVDKFIFPADFMILYCEADEHAPIILGRPFLVTGRVMIDFEKGELALRVDEEQVKIKVFIVPGHHENEEECKASHALAGKCAPRLKPCLGAHTERDKIVMFLRDA
ncbi:hypothetical protein V6N13_104272 [Hibiscus sabdariffa]